ncbi:MAG: DUF6623 family protein [Halobacteriota archaeon]
MVTSKAVTWIPGTAVMVEFPKLFLQNNEEICRSAKGYGTFFWAQENTSNWFHFPFQTSAVDGSGPKLTKVIVLYETYGWTQLTDVHVWDGQQPVKKFENLGASGKHWDDINLSNSWPIDPPKTLQRGLGVSVKVSFGPKVINERGPGIIVIGAGAEFEA